MRGRPLWPPAVPLPILAGELSRLINDSIDACSFPDMFKLAVVSSQFKKIDNLIKSNYRPVSLLIVMSKVYERVMANQLLAYFENIFSPLLSAFRKNYGCQSTLLNMVQHFKNCIDNGQFVGCIGMDLSKAFDCLPHRLTICKLRAYGASRNACTLLASYLYCRKQRVKNFQRMQWLGCYHERYSTGLNIRSAYFQYFSKWYILLCEGMLHV